MSVHRFHYLPVKRPGGRKLLSTVIINVCNVYMGHNFFSTTTLGIQ